MYVRFLKHKKDGQVLAVFPDVVADFDGNLMGYAHIGQCVAVSKDYIRECGDATSEEKAALKKEMQELGYYPEEDEDD